MTDKEILQGIDKLDAELPFDEICVGGNDNWHDIDVHELLYEVKERIKEWHYPSRGEYPTDDEEVLVIAESDHSRYKSLETYYPDENEWSTVWKIIAWQYIEPPKEEA